MLLKLFVLLFIWNGCLADKLYPQSFYSYGGRIAGDKLIASDSLHSPKSLTPQNHTISFQLPIYKQVITYIELSSNSNVYAEFTINTDETEIDSQLLRGTLTALKSLEFFLNISVFGFNISDKPKDLQSITHPKIAIAGEMKPQFFDDEHYDDDYEDEYEDEDDSVLIIGERQPGDEMVHTQMQFSETTETRRNHSVKFYYVDKDYITLAKFIPHKTSTASATFSQITAHTLKAEIYDTNALNLDVTLELYGFKPEHLPSEYYPPYPGHAKPLTHTTIKPIEIKNDHSENSTSSSNSISNLFNFLIGIILILTFH